MVKTYIKNLKLFKTVYLNKLLTIDKVESTKIIISMIFSFTLRGQVGQTLTVLLQCKGTLSVLHWLLIQALASLLGQTILLLTDLLN